MKTTFVTVFLVILFAGLILAAASCAPPGRVPESDSNYSFSYDSVIPVDPQVYEIYGQVAAGVDSLVRQVAPSQAVLTGYDGYTSATYYGPQLEGKGLVRLLVYESNSPLAPPGNIVLLKMTDTKGTLLLPGDIVTLKCRAQYESLAAIYSGEPITPDFETWELDYCRLASPTIQLSQGK